MAVLETSLGEEADYETVKSVYENISLLVADTKESPDPLTFTKPEVQRILEDSGVTDEQLTTFSACYDEAIGEQTSLQAANLTNTKKFEIKTPHIRIQIDPECTGQIETKMVDGRQCLVIAVDDHVEVNGMEVKTLVKTNE